MKESTISRIEEAGLNLFYTRKSNQKRSLKWQCSQFDSNRHLLTTNQLRKLLKDKPDCKRWYLFLNLWGDLILELHYPLELVQNEHNTEDNIIQLEFHF